MATWDSADLLERCRRMAGRPDTDASMPDPDWYALLTQAEAHYLPQLAAHVPEVLYGPPEKMTTSDGGFTYEVSEFPLGRMTVRESPTGRVLRPSSEWDNRGDIVIEGKRIRFPSGRSRQFLDGPYAYYVKAPGVIDQGTQSRLPDLARIVLVYHAVALWAARGGYRDPGYFERLERKAWSGDPEVPGDTGILGALKTAYYGSGMAGINAADQIWYYSGDLGG